jgi:response regulator RpfG family c-di-GMP phosphodiesterase
VKLLKNILTDEGYYVMRALNGQDALSIIENEETVPDLIVLDIDMPITTGTEVQNKLMENPETKNIPIIFLTGMLLRKEEAKVGYQIGSAFLMSKPIEKELLLEEIKKRI